MTKAVPMVCVVCVHTTGSYYGRLVFPQETEQPTCPNHEKADPSLVFPLTSVNVKIAPIREGIANL